MKKFILFAAVLTFFFVGCAPKEAEIKEWDRFQSTFFKVSFMYPKGWYVVAEPNRILVYNTFEAAEKFFTHDPKKEDGVQIIVAAESEDVIPNLDTYIQSYHKEQTDAGFEVSPIMSTTLEGLPAKKVEYKGAYDQETRIKGIRIATVKDSVVYFVQFSAFNKMYEPYKFVLDSVVSSLTLPKKIVVEKGVDPAIPFVETERYNSDFIEFQYPINFGVVDLPKKGSVLYNIQVIGKLEGFRKDCDIQIDVRPAQKLNVEKVVEQNLKFYKVTSRGETKISGEKAIFLNYSPIKNIESRVYFVVKNDKIYRITLNYFAPMKNSFLPAFEKVVASIHIK
ncbi:MAG: hypothetical protein N3A63_00695 [Bacteroidetes bacterium]|nr:hypothetical protein [Bacteroidota bacterium]